MRWLALVVAVGAASACGSVPDITFVDLTSDGGEDGGSDATSADAPSDGLVSDGPPPQDNFVPSCPSATPPGYDGCCGATPCKGNCPGACGSCIGCKANDVCCGRTNPMCKPAVSCN